MDRVKESIKMRLNLKLKPLKTEMSMTPVANTRTKASDNPLSRSTTLAGQAIMGLTPNADHSEFGGPSGFAKPINFEQDQNNR